MSIFIWILSAILFLLLAVFLFWRIWFLRDPEREIPEKGILCPGDGLVTDVRIISLPASAQKGRGKFNFSGKEIGEKALMISIFMSPLDVHVNRSPIAGEVTAVRYSKGGFHPADSERAHENESNEIILEGEDITVGVVQVAGIMARRIECFVAAGQKLERGQRIGLINLGSRVVLLLPTTCEPAVTIGEKVKAGSTVIAEP